MSLRERIKRWLGLADDADAATAENRESASDEGADREPATRARSPTATPSTDPNGDGAAADPTIPEAEPGRSDAEGPSLKCTVCGTVADAVTTCPLCGSSDLRPATAAEAAESAPRRSDGDRPLVEEAERGGVTSESDDDGTPAPNGDDAVASGENSTGGIDLSGPGPARTRSDRATDDEAVSRLRELTQQSELEESDEGGDGEEAGDSNRNENGNEANGPNRDEDGNEADVTDVSNEENEIA